MRGAAFHPAPRGCKSLRLHRLPAIGNAGGGEELNLIEFADSVHQRRFRFTTEIPDVPPSSTKAIPAPSRAAVIAVRLFAIGTRRPFSKSRTVESETEALAASCA